METVLLRFVNENLKIRSNRIESKQVEKKWYLIIIECRMSDEGDYECHCGNYLTRGKLIVDESILLIFRSVP